MTTEEQTRMDFYIRELGKAEAFKKDIKGQLLRLQAIVKQGKQTKEFMEGFIEIVLTKFE